MHVWYLKRLPSYIVNLLDKLLNELEDLESTVQVFEIASSMYPPILNFGYINDKIVFDWIKYEPPIEDERR
ncbi:hypothetical protein Ccrd_014794 [Cynara cardunculus var. scolymus]|uniref:Uncharacterized protein n=1 Tax=Cynara cardunculus var. scolymus TaxID=59895 RepID=A0A103YD15_CYNCS|nr:hypothetical protein Ccrd_014794 [Cynara cardunculus var. scolymus]